jgi:hypothetical protein
LIFCFYRCASHAIIAPLIFKGQLRRFRQADYASTLRKPMAFFPLSRAVLRLIATAEFFATYR